MRPVDNEESTKAENRSYSTCFRVLVVANANVLKMISGDDANKCYWT